MNCPEAQKILNIKQTQTPQDKEQLFNHVAKCKLCQDFCAKNLNIGSTTELAFWIDKNLTPQHPLLTLIDNNPELKRLELEGFKRGDERGKTIGVNENVLSHSLQKQWGDYLRAFYTTTLNDEGRKTAIIKSLADLRNVAGVMFIQISNPEPVVVNIKTEEQK